MVISIRRSRHEEGEELVAIWCRSVDATHDFLSAEYRAELEVLVHSFLPEAPLWVAVNERDQPVGFMLLSGSIWMRCLSILMCAAAAWVGCWWSMRSRWHRN